MSIPYPQEGRTLPDVNASHPSQRPADEVDDELRKRQLTIHLVKLICLRTGGNWILSKLPKIVVWLKI